MRPAGFPEHESVHSAPADKSRWGLFCFQGRIERNGGEDLTSCSGCGSGCCDECERESLRLAPLISARRSDTLSVDLQGTRSCRHAPQCHPCARFGPFWIRHLVQRLNYVSPSSQVCRLQMSPSPVLHGLRALRFSVLRAPDMRRRFVAPEDFL